MREPENLREQQEQLQGDDKALQQDHMALSKLLQHLSEEYEALTHQHRCLKTLHRDLELENKALRERCVRAVQGDWGLPGLMSPLCSGPSCLPWTRCFTVKRSQSKSPSAMWSLCSYSPRGRRVPKGTMVCTANPGSGRHVRSGVPAPLRIPTPLPLPSKPRTGGGSSPQLQVSVTCFPAPQDFSSLSEAELLSFI